MLTIRKELTDANIRSAYRRAWLKLDMGGSVDAESNMIVCEILGCDPWELQAWIDNKSSEEICKILM